MDMVTPILGLKECAEMRTAFSSSMQVSNILTGILGMGLVIYMVLFIAESVICSRREKFIIHKKLAQEYEEWCESRRRR